MAYLVFGAVFFLELLSHVTQHHHRTFLSQPRFPPPHRKRPLENVVHLSR
jgi:hypothetical protein